MDLNEPQEIAEFLSSFTPEVRAIALALRRFVHSNAPDVGEQVDLPAKMLAYSFAKTYKDMLCVIMPQKNSVNFGFPMGATLSDPQGLLSGTGKRARHVKITNAEQITLPALRTLMEQALKAVGKYPDALVTRWRIRILRPDSI